MLSIETLTPAMQDYLEAIYHLQREKRVARVKEIAKRLKVKLPSVSGALKSLKSKKLVHHEEYGYVTLTAEGLRLAEQVARRHEAVRRFLTTILQIDDEQAQAEACRLEHAVSAETLKRLLCLIEFVENCPRGGQDWLKHLSGRWDDEFHCDGNCKKCIASIVIPAGAPCAEETQTSEPSTVPLSTQEPGFRGVIKKVVGRGRVRRRMTDMGVTAGTEVEIERVAPLGDPVEIKVKGYHLSLRKEEAANIYVAPE